MNKTGLIKEVSKKCNLSQKECLSALNAMTEIIAKTLKSGDEVGVLGFGKFEMRDRKARKSINPKTREPILIAASRVPVFRISKSFKQSIS